LRRSLSGLPSLIDTQVSCHGCGSMLIGLTLVLTACLETRRAANGPATQRATGPTLHQMSGVPSFDRT
jgi:hypothetical protein